MSAVVTGAQAIATADPVTRAHTRLLLHAQDRPDICWSPGRQNCCFSRATRNPKPLACDYVDGAGLRLPASKERGGLRRTEAGGGRWLGSSSLPPLAIKFRQYEFLEEIWAASFSFIAKGNDGLCCRCSSWLGFSESTREEGGWVEGTWLKLRLLLSQFTHCALLLSSVSTLTRLSSPHPSLWPLKTDSHWGHSYISAIRTKVSV